MLACLDKIHTSKFSIHISFVVYVCVSIAEQHTVGFSQSSLIHLVGPSDCTLHDYVHGGESLCFFFLFSSCKLIRSSDRLFIFCLVPESCSSKVYPQHVAEKN